MNCGDLRLDFCFGKGSSANQSWSGILISSMNLNNLSCQLFLLLNNPLLQGLQLLFQDFTGSIFKFFTDSNLNSVEFSFLVNRFRGFSLQFKNILVQALETIKLLMELDFLISLVCLGDSGSTLSLTYFCFLAISYLIYIKSK